MSHRPSKHSSRSSARAGFTLIELLIVLAIVAILASIAIAQYQDYVSRTRATGAAAELSGVRKAVSICISERQTATACSTGLNGIPATVPGTDNVLAGTASVVNGEIRATTGATASSGGPNLTWINTPNFSLIGSGELITWTNTGTVCDQIRGLRSGQGDCP
jgi:type IV pilus assembly protein PilA